MNPLPKLAPQERDPTAISNRKSVGSTPGVSPTKQTKGPQISNREGLRLEIDVTPTKQTPDLSSNREKMALFAGPPTSHETPPFKTPRPGKPTPEAESMTYPALNSNRKSTQPSPHVTPTKQRKPPQFSNREALRLEINVTSTKQRPDSTSNRERTPLFGRPPESPALRTKFVESRIGRA